MNKQNEENKVPKNPLGSDLDKRNMQNNESDKPQNELNNSNQKKENKDALNKSDNENKVEEVLDPVSKFLLSKGINNNYIGEDHIGIETISIEPNTLYKAMLALKENGFDYLQCQGGYDEGPGKNLVCFYHLISIDDFILKNESLESKYQPKEVRIKVFLPREGQLTVPSLYKIFKGSDWQERETFDMFGIKFEGHPHPKRLLMPEDWKGWPLRKDYIQPDFYEMQDAY